MFGGYENEEKFGEGLETEEIVDELRVELNGIESNDGLDFDGKLAAFQEILHHDRSDDEAIKVKEDSFSLIVTLYCDNGKFDDILSVIESNSTFFESVPKAKTAKMVRNALQIVSKMPDSLDLQQSLCHNIIDWCEKEKRNFLKHRVESKLCGVLFLKVKSDRF